MNANDENAIVQNLVDAGCGQEFIAEFMEDFRKKNISKDLRQRRTMETKSAATNNRTSTVHSSA